MGAAKASYDFLVKFFNPTIDSDVWQNLRPELQQIFRLESYDQRKKSLCILSGNREIDYKKVTESIERSHKPDFVRAASNHLAEAMKLFSDLPRAT